MGVYGRRCNRRVPGRSGGPIAVFRCLGSRKKVPLGEPDFDWHLPNNHAVAVQIELVVHSILYLAPNFYERADPEMALTVRNSRFNGGKRQVLTLICYTRTTASGLWGVFWHKCIERDIFGDCSQNGTMLMSVDANYRETDAQGILGKAPSGGATA